MEEREHILNILKEVKFALRENKAIRVKGLSNQMVHNASINQDPDVLYIAVIIYSLSKLIEREDYQDFEHWKKFYSNYKKRIDNLINDLEKNNLNGFHEDIHSILNSIDEITGKLNDYIKEVFRKAKINKASRIYEHGISMEKTAKILGISIWELAEYAGKTGIGDVDLSVTMPVKDRIKIAEEIFKR
jgi:hypothetical protein